MEDNRIGTDVNGTTMLGNGRDGVVLANGASGNRIGGSGSARNIISGNKRRGVSIGTDDGVVLGSPTRNVVQGN
ncbi:MAG: hypothetical protein COS85_20220 [Armatimonadetes bacterium CG07_land_8_20_14_0_80_59_28]|nr:MAG: hypothetical protein COS85_20220 [Armatimonadetes bacterium CG07_land_8_20_14_0_80_59_28]PIX41309.1 MAG: hypothetical protein COZ56_12370 [Armatimonadetes bacterium CG_4_8_14_3_um_filter_58_9]PIY43157.1 MAG: hypothetical protein COZ05_11950 [Armatimonadetes bacterium CG_4_10_14_3_um_filter_59_10]PJB76434.1 MAG: hypothetical protein CO095_02605 [Armatimonadetes bacterium CG_4_9_14_3_um_filter_58_7]